MVQLPEVCDENSEAYKAGYKHITEIGKERIRRAGQKIVEENPLERTDLDIGFSLSSADGLTADSTLQIRAEVTGIDDQGNLLFAAVPFSENQGDAASDGQYFKLNVDLLNLGDLVEPELNADGLEKLLGNGVLKFLLEDNGNTRLEVYDHNGGDPKLLQAVEIRLEGDIPTDIAAFNNDLTAQAELLNQMIINSSN